MKLKIISGSYSSHNTFSSDIGWQGLLACGNNNYVQIIDPISGQLIQTLERHQNHVHLVKWAPCSFYHDLKRPYSLKLASSDISGAIIIWECSFSTVLSEFNIQGRKVLDLHWLKNQEVSIDFVLVLHTGGNFVLWNTDSGNKVWTTSLTDTLFDFCLDPHDPSNATFRGDDFIILLSGISLLKPPEGSGRKFFICNAMNNNGSSNNNSTSTTMTMPDNTTSSSRGVVARSAKIIKATTKLVMDFGGANEMFKGGSNTESGNNLSCIQVLYHGYCQNHIILVYPREILIMDLMIFQAVACISLDKNIPNFIKVYSCWQNDILYCLHENGIVTIRGRRPLLVTEDGLEVLSSNKYKTTNNETEINESSKICLKYNCWSSWIEAGPYQTLCQTEAPRLMRNVRLVAMTVAPHCEIRLALISSDTRIQFWEMKICETMVELFPATDSFVLSPNNLVRIPENVITNTNNLFDITLPMVDYQIFIEYSKSSSCLADYRVIPNTCNIKKYKSKGRIEKWGKLSMRLTALYQGILSDPTAIATNPLNLNQCDWPVVAIGNSKGCLQIWNLINGQLEREYQTIHCPINGVEWLIDGSNGGTVGQLLLYGRSSGGGGGDWLVPSGHSGTDYFVDTGNGDNTSINSSNASLSTANQTIRVKNSMCVLNLANGRVLELRQDVYESPIDLVRVSQLKQYFAVLFRDGSIEIWDCVTVRKIRDIPAGIKSVSLLEWSNVRNAHLYKDRSNMEYYREKFLTIDSGGFLQHIVIEGSLITKGRRVPVETSLNRVTAMAYWNNVVILGDFEGNLLFWNFKTSKSIPGLLGSPSRILKIKLANNRPSLVSSTTVSTNQQAPTSGSRLAVILSVDSVSVWNWNEGSILKQIKWGSNAILSRVLDCDWADDGQSLVLLSGHELCIVRGNNLEKSSSAVNLLDFRDSNPQPCNLRMLPPKVISMLKCYLQHQAWRSDGKFSIPYIPIGSDDLSDDSNWMKLFPDLKQFIQDKLYYYVFDWLNKKKSSLNVSSSLSAAHQLVLRCYQTAELLGDEYEMKFWLVVLFNYFPHHHPGNSHWIWDGIYLPLTTDTPNLYRATQQARLFSLERKRSSGSQKQTMKCAEAFIMLGELDKAVRLLLETPPNQPTYVADLQLACLLSNQTNKQPTNSSITASPSMPLVTRSSDDTSSLDNSSSQQHHSTVKLVATQFLANNHLREGVQLLCAIGKQQDACRYLETYNEWKTALWLARCTLSTKEIQETEKRWVNAILNSQSCLKSNALLQLVNLKEADKVMDLLVHLHQYQLAVRFLEFCQLFKSENNHCDETHWFTISEDNKRKSISEFCHILVNIGCKEMKNYYSKTYLPEEDLIDDSNLLESTD